MLAASLAYSNPSRPLSALQGRLPCRPRFASRKFCLDLFQPYRQRSLLLRNRIAVSPMCQYLATEGVPDDWHLMHLGRRAVGGAAAVIAEATAVSPEGRIPPVDSGLWNKTQMLAWARIVSFITVQGAIAGVQLAHAGRKASTAAAPWQGGKAAPMEQGGAMWWRLRRWRSTRIMCCRRRWTRPASSRGWRISAPSRRVR